jgi:hypothetical protein
MKKPLLILITLASFAYNAAAQISINHTDFQPAGKTYISQTITAEKLSQFNKGGSGENQHWDFSTLKKAEGTPDTLIFVNPAQTPWFNNFPTSTFAETRDAGDFSFYQQSASGIDIIGETGLGLAGKFNPPLTFIKFPMNFGSSNRSTGQLIIKDSTSQSGPLMDSVRIVVDIIHEYVADGWGTIKTPGGSFDVLRIASKTISVSETQLHFKTGMWTSLDDKQVNASSSYSWYAKGYGSDIFTVNFDRDSTWSKLTSVEWLESVSDNVVLGTDTKMSEAEINISPNPSRGSFIVVAGNASPVTSVFVYNAMGAEVKSFNSSGNVMPYEVSDLEDGLYTLKISTEKDITTEKLVIRK